MGTYLSPWFYAAVCLLYFGLQWAPPRLSRTTWFGLLNLAALGLILGAKTTLLVVAFTSVLWASLFCCGLSARRLPGEH